MPLNVSCLACLSVITSSTHITSISFLGLLVAIVGQNNILSSFHVQ